MRTALWLVSVLCIGAILYLARVVLIPIALAFLITALLNPVVRRLERIGLPRVAAVLVSVAVTTLAVGVVGWLVKVQVTELASHAAQYQSNLQKKLAELRPEEVSVLGPVLKAVEQGGDTAVPGTRAEPNEEAQPSVPVVIAEDRPRRFEYTKALASAVLSPITTAGMVVIFSIFLLIKQRDVRNRLIRLLGEREMHLTTPALDEAEHRISRYIILQSAINGATGLIIGVGLLLLGVPGALVWGLLVALLRFLPYLGIWVAAIAPLVVSLAASPGWGMPIYAVALVAAVELVVANIIEPAFLSASTGVSAIAIFVGAVFWAWLWGPIGLLLATPLTVCLVVIGRHVPGLGFLGIILSDEQVLPEEAQLFQRALAGDADEAEAIVAAFAKDKPVVDTVDLLIIPALRLAGMARYRGEPDDERDRTVLEVLDLTVDDLLEREKPEPKPAAEHRRLLCVPAHDGADELVARVLARLLSDEGLIAEAASREALASEQLEMIASLGAAVVCISAVPPGSLVHARVMGKRIHARFPELPIMLGLWDGRTGTARPERARDIPGAIHVVGTLRQALTELTSLSGLSRGQPASAAGD